MNDIRIHYITRYIIYCAITHEVIKCLPNKCAAVLSVIAT